ncbi:MAG TPA: MBL fold metallo-hydrolase [Vicinamibacterales bacterium]|nr:MBL fold metallo-hydrolase [Vicinamibacterales bacterium]
MDWLLLPAGNAGPYTGPSGNNTYLVRGRAPLLVDAGVGEAAHLDALARALAGAPLARVVVTHVHSDHASGAPALAARWPSAEFLKRPWPERDARYAVPWRPIEDGQEIVAGDVVLRVVATPGHAPDHIALFEPVSRMLFSGDLVSATSSVVVPGTRGGDLADYLASLRRVLALQPSMLLPAHGPVIDDPAAVVRAQLAHREARERQILDVLAAGAASIEEIRSAVYAGVDPALAEAARDTIRAHLTKLRREGRVEEMPDGRWRPV